MRIVPEERRKTKPGDRFNRLTVLGLPFYLPRGTTGRSRRYVVCHCDCGSIFVAADNDMSANAIKSCGCLLKELASDRLAKYAATNIGENCHSYKHGRYKTRLHRIWLQMRHRTLSPKSRKFHYYGGKGVRLCHEWNDFVAFHDWAMASGYGDNLTIDRIDSDGNYEPANCQWITRAENTARMNRHHAQKRRNGKR